MSMDGAILMGASPSELTTIFDNLARANVGILRFDIAWVDIENPRGRYDWQSIWNIVYAAEARGIKLVGIIISLAQWVNAGNTVPWAQAPQSVSQVAAYADFAQRVAVEFRGHFVAYELWNEPNLTVFWRPIPSTDMYAELLRQTYPAIRSVDSDVIILSGGTGGAGGNSTDIESIDFWTAIYEADTQQFFDVLCHHPYTYITGDMDGEMGGTDDIRGMMEAYGDGTKPIWGTETGAPTAGSDGMTISEAGQAQLLVDTYAHWWTLPYTGPLFWYTLHDKTDGDTTREGFFGIQRANSTDKPSFAAYAAVQYYGAPLRL